MILFNYIWFNICRCINNNMFLWYTTDDSISFTRFNCLYITTRMLSCTNNKNLSCNSTFQKTKNLGARKWILMMLQMTITIMGVFDYPDTFITIKGNIIVIEFNIGTPKYAQSKIYFSSNMPWKNFLMTLLTCFIFFRITYKQHVYKCALYHIPSIHLQHNHFYVYLPFYPVIVD